MSDPIQVGVIGCGGFARAVHLPNIARIPALRLRATCDLLADVAKAECQKHGADYYTADYAEILNDDDIDLCIITTRHDTHARLTLETATAGKHMLVEKPMCMTRSEVGQILAAVAEAGVTYTVGHNRRYAPLAVRLAEAAAGHRKPWIVNYRMVSQSWGNHWALDPAVGGGRLISEAGHIFEFLCWLLESEPRRIYAQGGQYTHPETPGAQDNAVIALTFENGSLATVIHGDMGHKALAKERIEVFLGEGAAVIDDFVSLETYGFGGDIRVKLDSQDKGHLRELELLAETIAAGGKMPVDEAAAARAMQCTFAALDSIKSGSAVELDSSTWLQTPSYSLPHQASPDFPPAADTSY